METGIDIIIETEEIVAPKFEGTKKARATQDYWSLYLGLHNDAKDERASRNRRKIQKLSHRAKGAAKTNKWVKRWKFLAAAA